MRTTERWRGGYCSIVLVSHKTRDSTLDCENQTGKVSVKYGEVDVEAPLGSKQNGEEVTAK